MKGGKFFVAIVILVALAGCGETELTPISLPITTLEENKMVIKLPQPRYDSDTPLEKTLLNRRSVRDYSDEPLTLEEVSQLLWAAQGTTANWGGRTAPSAGALYPLEVYVVAGNVRDLASGVYQYKPEEHKMIRIVDGDIRSRLAGAALGQSCVKEGAIDIVFTAVYERTTRKYGDRGIRYVHMEVGHAAQNVCLQAVAMNLGAAIIGAFHDDEVRKLMDLSTDQQVLYIVPVGKR